MNELEFMRANIAAMRMALDEWLDVATGNTINVFGPGRAAQEKYTHAMLSFGCTVSKVSSARAVQSIGATR